MAHFEAISTAAALDPMASPLTIFVAIIGAAIFATIFSDKI